MAEKLSSQKKKELAKIIYMQGDKSQLQIAEMVGVSKNTLSKWVVSEKWELERTSLTMTREQQLVMMYQQLSTINEDIRKRENKTPTSKDADIISKITDSIKKLENDESISDVMSVGKRVFNWLKNTDYAKAQEFVAVCDAYIKDNI